MSSLVVVRHITSQRREANVRSLGQSRIGYHEALGPLAVRLCLQLELYLVSFTRLSAQLGTRLNSLAFDVRQAGLGRDMPSAKCVLYSSVLPACPPPQARSQLTEHPAASCSALSWSLSYAVFPSPSIAVTRGHWYACLELAYVSKKMPKPVK